MWRILSPLIVLLAEHSSGVLQSCRSASNQVDCSNRQQHFKYRSVDGTCNNLQHTRWGSAGTPLLRLLSPQYEDGKDVPVGSFNIRYRGFKKPNPRFVSSHVVGAELTDDDERHTAMLMHFGQFLAHDMTHAREIEVNCSSRASADCFNIQVPVGDYRVPSDEQFPFARSESCLAKGIREQINSISAYIDASNVYGSNDIMMNRLRGNNGALRTNRLFRSRRGLPFLPYDDKQERMDCRRNTTRSNIPCFIAGDIRANEQTMLLSVHTVFVREHNRIAHQLAQLNPEWDAETIYQETRRIVGAIIQSIGFYQWLPKIIGPDAFASLREYNDYDPAVDSGIANGVAAAALRFGHGFVVPELQRMDKTYHSLSPIKLRDSFFSPEGFVQLNDFDSLIRGSVSQPVKEILGSSLVSNELIDNLFPNAHSFPLDLAAFNIQRGRDHALPVYNVYREMCGLPRIKSWPEFAEETRSGDHLQELASMYGHPDNVDLWLGGLLERPLAGAKIGRTFTCLLGDQFKRLRQGDRFWFEHSGVFGAQQLRTIRQYSLSKLLCNNIDEPGFMPPDAFTFYPLLIRQFVKCSDLPDLDLNAWRIEGDGNAGKSDCTSRDCICTYEIGVWGECQTYNQRQFRYDTLISGRYPPCTNQRVVTRICEPNLPPQSQSSIRSSEPSISHADGASFASSDVHVVDHFNGRSFNSNRQFGNLLDRRMEFFRGLRSPADVDDKRA